MSSTIESVAEAVRERLGERAFEHSIRVAQASGQLADIYGVDREAAQLAGVLHDWDRELEHEELLNAAEDNDLEVTSAEARAPKLLHARTAAAALPLAFPGISEDVVRAVERHTLGAVDMTPLDMVVYVADMVEPGRTYPGVDDLREAVGTLSLDELFAEAYRHSVLHVVKRRKPLHPRTVEVWNALVARSAP